ARLAATDPRSVQCLQSGELHRRQHDVLHAVRNDAAEEPNLRPADGDNRSAHRPVGGEDYLLTGGLGFVVCGLWLRAGTQSRVPQLQTTNPKLQTIGAGFAFSSGAPVA